MQFYDGTASYFVPAGIDNRGRYQPVRHRPIGRNGRGKVIAHRARVLTWFWDYVAISDWEWLTQTLLNDQPSREFVLFNHIDDQRQSFIFDRCIVDYPTYETMDAVYYYNVTLVVRAIT